MMKNWFIYALSFKMIYYTVCAKSVKTYENVLLSYSRKMEQFMFS